MTKERQETLRNDRVDEVEMLELKRFHNGREFEGSSPGQRQTTAWSSNKTQRETKSHQTGHHRIYVLTLPGIKIVNLF